LKISRNCDVRQNIFTKKVAWKIIFNGSIFRDSSIGYKVKIIKKNRWNCDVWIITFHVIYISWFQHSYKIKLFQKNSWNSVVRQNFFTKTCLTNNYLSCDPHFVILAWVHNWNISEELMKLCSPPEVFHKNMSHEQLLFMWSTFRDSSMGTKLKYFWQTHESV